MSVVRMRIVLLLLVLALVSCNGITETKQCATTQEGSGSLEGLFTAPSGAPLYGGSVVVGMNMRVETNAEGWFFIASLPAGAYTLESSHGRVTGTVNVVNGEHNVVRIVLPRETRTGFASGRILDACTGRPIVGARIGHPDETSPIITGVDGMYNRSACCNTELGVVITAAGYESQPFHASRIFEHTSYRDYFLRRR